MTPEEISDDELDAADAGLTHLEKRLRMSSCMEVVKQHTGKRPKEVEHVVAETMRLGDLSEFDAKNYLFHTWLAKCYHNIRQEEAQLFGAQEMPRSRVQQLFSGSLQRFSEKQLEVLNELLREDGAVGPEAERLVDLEDVVGDVSSDSDSEGSSVSSWPWRSIIFGTFALTLVILFSSRSWTLQSSDLLGMEQKTGIYPDRWETVQATTAAPHKSSNGLLPHQIGSVNDLTGGKDVEIFSTDPLARPENLLDGNVCAHDEELLGTLCYKKCSLLTDGKAPVRLSAFSCAKSKGFEDFFRGKIGLLVPCEGYDVSGDEAGHGCPHKPGTCLVNEEFSLGKCYKRCDELTDGQFPHRTSANTCCKTKNFLECIEPTESTFSFNYNVGGGDGSLAKSHSPNAKFTELGQ